MKMKSTAISTVLLLALALAPATDTKATTITSTTCYYTLVAGAPWADKNITKFYPGHTQCESHTATTVGYYRLTGQVHS